MGRLTQQALWATLEKAAHLGAGMGLLVLVARFLGEEALGNYAYAIAVTMVFVPVLDAGLHLRTLKKAAEDDRSTALAEAVGLKLWVGPVALVGMVLFAWLADKPADVVWAVLLIGISTVAMSWGDAVNAAFKGLFKAGHGALLVVGTNVALLGGGIWAMVVGGGVVGLAWCYGLCRVGYALAGWVWIGRVAPGGTVFLGCWRWAVVGDGLQHLPMAYFVAVLLNVHFLTVDGFGGGAVSAAYAIGYQAAAALFALGSASLEMLLSALSRDQKGQGTLLGRSFWALLAIGFVGAGVTHLAAGPATVFLFGPDLVSAVLVVQVLGWSLPPFLLCGLGHTALLAMGRARWALRIMVLFVAVGAMLGVGGFWVAGSEGTAWATVASGWIFVGVMVCAQKKVKKLIHSH